MAPKKRVGVILQGGSNWLGGLEYGKNLIKALYALPEHEQAGFELAILPARSIDPTLYADMPARFAHELSAARTPLWRRFDWRLVQGVFQSNHRWFSRSAMIQSALARQARQRGIDFLFPFNCELSGYGNVPAAAWIPDFQHRIYPEFFTQKEIDTRDRQFAFYARHAPRVVLSSQAAAREFARFYPEHASKAHVFTFCTVADNSWYRYDAAAVAKKYSLPERFFIVCNQFWQHKNHRVVFEALSRLRDRGIDAVVACTGNLADYRRKGYAAEVIQSIERLRIQSHVRLLGMIPRIDQIQLIRRSLAVIQPSLFEGWSTVVEDGRVLAKTFALSDLAVHREQDPPGARYFDAHDAQQLAEIMSAWWQELPAGPHLDKEEAARTKNRENVLDFGRRFIELAHKVSDRAKTGGMCAAG